MQSYPQCPKILSFVDASSEPTKLPSIHILHAVLQLQEVCSCINAGIDLEERTHLHIEGVYLRLMPFHL